MLSKIKEAIKNWKIHEILGVVLIIGLGVAVLTQQSKLITLTESNVELNKKIVSYNEKIKLLDDQLSQLTEEYSKVNQIYEDAYSKQIEYYNEALNQINADLIKQVKIIESGIPKNQLMRFYSVDNMGSKYLDHFKIQSSSQSVDIVLKELAAYLESHYFNQGKIEIADIRETDGLTIVTVNLTEQSLDGDGGWKSLYFQGSSGGYFTETVLIESFLQREMDKWPVDSVKFLYEGKNIQMDHVPNLEHIQNR